MEGAARGGPILLIALLGSGAVRAAPGPGTSPADVRRGVLSVAWGDPAPEQDGEAHVAYRLTDEDGSTLALRIDDALSGPLGGPEALMGRRVEVVLAGPGAPATVTEIRLLPDGGPLPAGTEPLGVTGSKPWISILCKFSDIGVEPEDLAYFQNMYGGDPGELDHYWREVSYEAIDVVGSLAVDWVDLPHAQGHYIPTPGSGFDADLDGLFDDCTAAADATGVDFSNGGTGGYEGINMMFNAVLDCCAWGGALWATLDGVTKLWRVTWEPPWGYADEAVIAHEMGHGFGLPHSNNSDGDGSPYDSPWDVMSSATGYAVDDPTYGRLGKHTIAYHKDLLGWIPAAERFAVAEPGIYSATLDHLALASTSNLRMITIPIGAGSKFYVVEAREQVGGYDGNLPGNAVLIHEVDPSRTEDAWLVDADDPPATYSDNEGSMWKVGETFEDLANEVQVTVDGAAPNGFDVTVTWGVPPTLTPSPATLDFGLVEMGESDILILQLINDSTGSQTVVVTGMELSQSVDFSLDTGVGASPCGSETPLIGSGEFCTVGVVFAPTVDQEFDESLSVSSNASAMPLSVPIEATSLPCPFTEHLVLPDETVDDTRTEVACLSITAGPYAIVAPGDVTLRAGDEVVLRDGFSVGYGASLTVEIF